MNSPICIALLLSTICLLGCNSSTSDSTIKDALSDAAGKKTANSCLLDYTEKLDALLTPEIAAATAGRDTAGTTYKYSKVLKNPVYHSVGYSWETDRTVEKNVVGFTIQVPVSDEVTLYGIQAVSLAAFKESRRNRTDEELEMAAKAMENALSGQTDNPEIKKRLKQLEEMGVDPETVVGTGKSLSGIAGEISQAYTFIPGLADAASWNAIEQRLYVNHQGAEFSVSVILGNDKEANKQKTIRLAHRLLDSCK